MGEVRLKMHFESFPLLFMQTPAACGLEEIFSAVLERFPSPFTLCVCSARIRLVIHINNK
jgi:hypothetical protein